MVETKENIFLFFKFGLAFGNDRSGLYGVCHRLLKSPSLLLRSVITSIYYYICITIPLPEMREDSSVSSLSSDCNVRKSERLAEFWASTAEI